jgi:hypothetical protein
VKRSSTAVALNPTWNASVVVVEAAGGTARAIGKVVEEAVGGDAEEDVDGEDGESGRKDVPKEGGGA